MKQNGRVSALLVELLIVLLFFMLAATTLMEIFGAAKQSSAKATASSAAMLESQNLAEQLYAADDVEKELDLLGFAKDGEAWRLHRDTYALTATLESAPTEAGAMRQVDLTATYKDELLFTLPAHRYIPGEVAE